MTVLPKSIRALIEHFDRMPGIGPKHAVRLALHLLNRTQDAKAFSEDIARALSTTVFCELCGNISDQKRCDLCRDANRDQGIFCVVAHVQDIEPVERTGKYNGLYHILHGTINPIEGITPDDLRVPALLERIKNTKPREVILALDSTADGDATAMYLVKILSPLVSSVTKLARGIPVGSSIEYTDEVTLSSAIEHRA